MPHRGFAHEKLFGGDLADKELLIALIQKGVEVHVPLFGATQQTIEIPNTFFYSSKWKSTFGTGTAIPNIVYLSKIIQINRIKPLDLIRMYNQDYGYAAFIARKWLGIPIVWNYHHLEYNFNERWQSFLFALHFDAITTVSHASKAELIESLGLPHDKVHVIYNGVSPFYSPKTVDIADYEQFNIRQKKILLFIGAFIPRKNLTFLLEVFAKIVSKRKDVILVLCGRDFSKTQEYENLLKKKANELGVFEKVIFRGLVSETEKLDWYNLCSVFVFPSLKEGFGLAAAEAMACGKPVVSSNTWSLPEIVDNGITGWTASPYCVDAFAVKVSELLDNSDMRQRFGEAARKKVLNKFKWEYCAEQNIELYTSIISNNRK